MSSGGSALAERKFRTEYATQRAADGYAHGNAELDRLPYLTTGRMARQWQVRARSFDALCRVLLAPARKAKRVPLSILDLGAGCAWLCHRVSLGGDSAVALDVRDDNVDGLGAATHYLEGTV
ncbi:MAG: class I SAM-dependent methyltransferase, partial [Gemmatimonadales bacterium]